MGTENAEGAFEVIDMKLPDLARQPQRWEPGETATVTMNKQREEIREKSGKVAIISGMSISGDMTNSMAIDLLMESLLGEAGGLDAHTAASKISRLIIAGNSLAEATPLPSIDVSTNKKASTKKYGYDSSVYDAGPPQRLDTLLASLLPSIPITILPGATDPANVSMPQQPIHLAMFPRARQYAAQPGSCEPGWFESVTNPWEADIDGWRIMVHGGQSVDDIFKYVEGDDRIDMMEHLLRWRCCAPTAPDTLCKFHLVFTNVKKLS